MPVTLSYPGVYIEELPSGTHTITGVATSIAAFIGWAAQGPANQATLVQSWSDFANQFGGLDARSYLGYAVNQFFGNGGQQAYIVRLTSGASPASITITGLDLYSVPVYPLTSPPTLSYVGSITTSLAKGVAGLVLTAANPGGWGNNYAVSIQPTPNQGTPNITRFSLSVLYIDPTGQAKPVAVESFPNLSLDSNDPRYVVNIINEQSHLVTAAINGAGLTITNDPTKPATAYVQLQGGGPGTVLAPATTKDSPGAFEMALNLDGLSGDTGVHYLDKVPIFNLLCVPGEIDPTTISELQAYCVSKHAFLIVDSQSTDTFVSLQNGPDSRITGSNSINAAFYFPWVNVFDPVLNFTRSFPPCGFIAGLYAATDASRGVWKAPAGIDVSLTGEAGLTTPLTDAQNGTLNLQAINCLRNFRVYGDVVWGGRTLRGNDQVGSEWKYIPIRRLALFLEVSLYEGTQWVVFEPNDEPLWGQIRLNIGAFMQGLFLQGAFQGTTPQKAYFVKCDSENNPQSSIDRGIVNILVGFAPLYPAEFVVIQIQQKAGQTQA